MSAEKVSQEIAVGSPASPPQRSAKRLIGLDAARGLALIGLIAIHIYPSADEETHEPTLAWVLFSGDSAALFALLAGVGLALSSGGPNVHRDRRMTADRVGLVVRAVLIGAVGLAISTITPDDPPAFGILLYYAVFFLLAIPFLHLRPRALFLSAAGFGITAPLLMQQLGPVLPGSSASNHTLTNLFTEPAGTASELLLTGAYPALPYMTYILVGMGLGRIDLRSTRVQVIITGTGAALAVAANGLSWLLLRAFGGYETLLGAADATEESLDESIMFGPDSLDTSWWWLTIATPHTNTPLAIAASLGMGLLVTGLFLLIAARTGRLLTPLAAMGSMTLTLYSAHLVALALEVHDQPHVWFMVHVGAAAAFAWFWHRSIGRGPLEVVVTRAVKGSHYVLLDGTPSTTTGGPAAPPGGR
ncbi:heparan-alpha-glucosaminide N-acetyltransferase domain-containing protein [Sediminivirga luteola]|uniref:heparan-alpha-glucosaminide N-acetyltransferase domain-containing protein n=1 Tax=Sediminivirga luteola TaxID=1774748 RepID=UPI001F59A600|nr:heparan-alpha-glucosaminide N-acetyltransferase domain-containing protein [Sediminivirga luteola]MCI2266998.1 DUF1624 domain-containing protein [Sediminivirga luteola]